MRIGYLFRGYLGDVKLDRNLNPVSSPDGNSTYSWTIEWECNRRGWKLIPLGENLDEHGAREHGENIFSNFSTARRTKSYERMLRNGWLKRSDRRFPDCDLVLIEWRWPIPGRNTPEDRGSLGFQGDLDRQYAVIEHYGKLGVPIVVWDLDHKMTVDDELRLKETCKGRISIVETSQKPLDHLITRTPILPPHVQSELLQFDLRDIKPAYLIGYIGSRYERDETIDHWIGTGRSPRISSGKRKQVRFWGKWEPNDEVVNRWPDVEFMGRITTEGFRKAYSSVSIVPLFGKRSYYDSGFLTPRIAEAITFGSIPIGLAGHVGVERFVDTVADRDGLIKKACFFKEMSPIRRRVYREEAAHAIKDMDVSRFVETLSTL